MQLIQLFISSMLLLTHLFGIIGLLRIAPNATSSSRSVLKYLSICKYLFRREPSSKLRGHLSWDLSGCIFISVYQTCPASLSEVIGFAKILLMKKHVHVVSRQMMSLWPLLHLVLTFASAKPITSGYTGKYGYKMGGD